MFSGRVIAAYILIFSILYVGAYDERIVLKISIQILALSISELASLYFLASELALLYFLAKCPAYQRLPPVRLNAQCDQKSAHKFLGRASSKANAFGRVDKRKSFTYCCFNKARNGIVIFYSIHIIITGKC